MASQTTVSVCGAVVERDFLGAVFFSMFSADLLRRLCPVI
jgi:hypothetical protein